MNRPPATASALAATAEPRAARVKGFRTKLFVTMMLVVFAFTALGLSIAERNLTASVERDLQREFQSDLTLLNNTREIRRAALAERCRALSHKPRIQGAIEEFQDVVYDNAESELSDIMENGGDDPQAGDALNPLRARFYRFLNRSGTVLVPPQKMLPTVGPLQPGEEARLALPAAPADPQIGYIVRAGAHGPALAEIIATPIVSDQSGEVIAALVLGFKPVEFSGGHSGAGLKSGLWLDGQLHLPSLAPAAAAALNPEVLRAAAAPVRVVIEGAPHLLFSQRLNPGSVYPPAYEVCLYPLATLIARQWHLRWQILGAGGLLLLGALGASHLLAGRLSAPVEKLAVDSERSERFSADASHQLKTPVTVLRAGLEELLARDNLTPDECAEISALIHQTYRLSSLIEDLLLLSRMDSGRLRLEFSAVDLTQLIEASLDDLSATPDDMVVAVETDFPAGLHIAGEKRYTAMILQNLLENARKYNRRGGRIRIAATVEGDTVRLTIGNTGRPISPAAQARIFERFHRGAIGENVPGYGLGLNLARELARLHQGDLRLVRSDQSWTEFEVRFRSASPAIV